MRDYSDLELVRAYARQNSEPAFAELVRRHLALVYSAALRHTGLAAQAEEISQAVFIILARKATNLQDGTVVEAWLYETARLTALSWQRAERRRQFREQEAYMQSALQESTTDPVWQQMAPLLDEAMMRLGSQEREAIVLRFFKDQNLRETAAGLNLSEPAAQKRVHRALEKLRKFFAKRGVNSTTAIIAGAISANSVQAAPVALAKSVAAVAMAKGAAASASTLTLIQGTLKTMAWTKVKTVTICSVGILLAAGTTAVVVKEINEPTAPVIRITGKGQIELFGGAGKSRVVETANLVIETDGKAYRLSVDSTGHNNLTNDVYDVRAEYGSDGRDFFELSDRLSPLHRTHAGFGGFAHPGRFPYTDEAPPSVVHAAWLAYCSRDYFNQSSNHTGFQLVGEFSGFWPAFVTNLPTYWPDSTLPQKMIGWSRNWWIPPRTDSLQPLQAVELKQYPSGFKVWKFTASDPIILDNRHVPRQITLETYFPEPPATATTGEETMLLRKASFTADSIEIRKGKFDPLPKVPVPDLQVMDARFEDVAANFVITSHADSNGWPTRGSEKFKQADAEAAKTASANQAFIQSEKKKVPMLTPP